MVDINSKLYYALQYANAVIVEAIASDGYKMSDKSLLVDLGLQVVLVQKEMLKNEKEKIINEIDKLNKEIK